MLLKKENLPRLIKDLKSLYPATKTALHYKDAFQLLCAVILSAQCTDKRVNMVTPVLFKKYPNAKAISAADIKDIEAVIKPTGFYRAKAKSIRESAKTILKDFGGKVPDNMDDILKLRGVARKTANVVLQDFYGVSVGVVVDTHVKRLSYRIGMTKQTEPVKVERDLMKLLDKKYWHWISHAFIWHGRGVCRARGPKCSDCKINSYCPKNGLPKT
ncbi:MAG: endonuclease III [Elusimicrobiota bacterium]|jgi:endonuclease-3|nr:endonuclease III [Elusimicrobiota bacterium]